MPSASLALARLPSFRACVLESFAAMYLPLATYSPAMPPVSRGVHFTMPSLPLLTFSVPPPPLLLLAAVSYILFNTSVSSTPLH